MIVGAIVQTTAVNATQYIFARLILGFGLPACIVAGSSLIGELGYPKERPVLTSLLCVPVSWIREQEQRANVWDPAAMSRTSLARSSRRAFA